MSESPKCIKCNNPLTDENWTPSLKQVHYHICSDCYNTYHRERYRKTCGQSKTGEIMLRTRITGNFTNDLLKLLEHLNHFCYHYDATVIDCLEGIVDWRIMVSTGDAPIDDLPKMMKIHQ